MQKYCLNCMQPLGASSVCRRCGYDNLNNPQPNKYHLRPHTLLANRYLVGNVLGEGGFGITYIGLDTTLSKRVAIKEFYPMGAANRYNDESNDVIVAAGKQEFFTGGVQRFLFEAKSVAAFSDEDGIVDVLDHFQENNTAYIVMEYLEGETLKQHIGQKGVMQPDKLIGMMIPVMKSLHAMHSKSIIHRDISPDNIMMTKGGKLKLMDFGSARYFTNSERELSIVLKQGFAPEEQYRKNSKQGPYTDVYALCATIYACITGKVPFDSLDRMANDELQPPSKLNVDIPPYQELALMHGMALLASNRTQNMEQLIEEFTTPHDDIQDGYNDFSQNRSNGEQQKRHSSHKKNTVPLIFAIVLTIAALLAAGSVIRFMLVFDENNKDSPGVTAAPRTFEASEIHIATENNPVIVETTAPSPTRPIFTLPFFNFSSLTNAQSTEETTTYPPFELTTAKSIENTKPFESYPVWLDVGVLVYEYPEFSSEVTYVIDLSADYTIVEEAYDEYGNLWGKLKSGVGWVNLSRI